MATERIQRRKDRLLDHVEEAADQEDWEAVRMLSRQVLMLDPDNADAITFPATRNGHSLTPAQSRRLGHPRPTSHVRRREHVGRRITRLDS